MKCDMCDCHTSKIVKIRNHKNGNELNICRGCAVQNGFIKKPSDTHWECKYCDCTRGVPYADEPDFMVCARCGAEGKIVRCWLMMNINYFRMEAEG